MGLIYFIILILIILSVLVVLAFRESFRIKFKFNSKDLKIGFEVLWLYPFFKAIVEQENGRQMVRVYLFKQKIAKFAIKRNKAKLKDNLNLLKTANPSDININAAYGFSDPFATAVTCGAINAIKAFIKKGSIYNKPDFIAVSNYINIDASARVNAGQTFINLLKNKYKGEL